MAKATGVLDILIKDGNQTADLQLAVFHNDLLYRLPVGRHLPLPKI